MRSAFARTRDLPAALYLLALVRDAMGDDRGAADCYRKVVYLEPNHAEALMHLALLAEKRGDSSAARRLQLRSRRVEEIAVQ
jgi:chemotaxis protein methyltransferase WspC